MPPYDDASKNVSFSQRKGSFSGMLKSRTFKIVLVTKDNAQPLDFNAAGKVVTYTGKAVSVKL